MSNAEQTQGVPAGWLIERRAGDWFSLRAPDGCEWNFCDDEGFDGPDRLICKLLDAMLSAAPQAQPVEAEQATSETPEKTPTGYSRPPNGEPAHPEDWNAGYEAGLADGHEIGADAGRLPVAWMYEHDGCNDEPILTAVRWPECREPWNETPLDALALAKHAIEKVWLDAVGTGNGEHSISEAARARVEFAADALKLGLRLPDALRKTGVESPLPKPAQPVEAEQAATGAHGTFPAPDLRGIDGATHSEWRFLRVPANEMLIQEKDLPEIIKRACLAYVSQPAQPVREPMSVDAIRDAIDDAGMDWHNGWTVGEDSENRYLNLCRAIERHHGIDAARANR